MKNLRRRCDDLLPPFHLATYCLARQSSHGQMGSEEDKDRRWMGLLNPKFKPWPAPKKTRAKTTSLGRGLVVRRPTSLGFFPLYQCCASRPIAPRLLGIDQEGLSQLPRRIHSWLRKSNPSWRTLNRRESENNTHPSVLNQLTRRYQKATEFVTGSKLFKHPNGFEKSRNSSESFRIWFVSLRETHEAIPLCGATLRPTPNDLDGWAWPTFSIPRYLSNQSSDWTYSNLKMFGAV